MPSNCEVREMRNAKAELVIMVWLLESGLRSKDSWVRSEGGRWKSAHRGNSLTAYPTTSTVLKPLRPVLPKLGAIQGDGRRRLIINL